MEVLVQLVDFLLKASVAYVQTPDGQKELGDIEREVSELIGDVLSADAAESVAPSTPAAADAAPRAGNRFQKPSFRGQ